MTLCQKCKKGMQYRVLELKEGFLNILLGPHEEYHFCLQHLIEYLKNLPDEKQVLIVKTHDIPL